MSPHSSSVAVPDGCRVSHLADQFCGLRILTVEPCRPKIAKLFPTRRCPSNWNRSLSRRVQLKILAESKKIRALRTFIKLCRVNCNHMIRIHVILNRSGLNSTLTDPDPKICTKKLTHPFPQFFVFSK